MVRDESPQCTRSALEADAERRKAVKILRGMRQEDRLRSLTTDALMDMKPSGSEFGRRLLERQKQAWSCPSGLAGK